MNFHLSKIFIIKTVHQNNCSVEIQILCEYLDTLNEEWDNS